MKKRDYYFDNAKFILIFLVVFGHLIQSYVETNTIIENVYKLIYSFHMPAFILVSGYFAKGIYQKGYVGKLMKKLILPYLIFQIIYTIFYYFLLDKNTLQFDFLNPQWSLWFLLSLFYWNLMLLAFTKLKPSYAIAIAVTTGLVIGYVDWISNYLSLSRTFVFFPFFLVGFYLKRDHFQRVASHKSKLFAMTIVIVIGLIFVLYPGLDEKWLLGSKPYSDLETVTAIGILKRMGVYFINFIMVGCFFAFVPNRKLFFTKWGRNTLYVYLLHGFVIRTFRGSDFEGLINHSQTVIILLIIALGLTSILSSKFVTVAAQPFIELKWSRWKQFLGDMKDNLTSAKRA